MCESSRLVSPGPAPLSAMVFGRGDGEWTWSNGHAQTRICVQDQRVAWVQCSTVGIHFSDRLADALQVPLDGLRRHLDACRENNRRLADYLADEGVMSPVRLRGVLGSHNAQHLAAFLDEDWESPAFAGASRHYERRMTFALEDLLPGNEDLVAFEDMLRADGERIDLAIDRALEIDGAVGAAVVEHETGMCIAADWPDAADLERAAAGNAEMLRAQLRASEALGVGGGLEDMLISLRDEYHLVRPLAECGLFMLLVLDRDAGNLAMARHELREIAGDLRIGHTAW